METTERSLPKHTARRNQRRVIEQWRNNLLDLEATVDVARIAVDRAVDDLRAAVRERDRAVAHLQNLLELHRERAA